MNSEAAPDLQYDQFIQDITAYVYDYQISSPKAWIDARIALLDSMACAIESVPACSSFIGPISEGTIVPNGFPLPGTSHVLDPHKAAFDLGSLIRYLDHSDAFPGKEWGHPSDNIGAILPVADWLSRKGDEKITMELVAELATKAYEIQGCLQMKNAFNEIGIDHVILVKLASTAVLSKLVGLSRDQANAAISQVFADGQPLRLYRQAPNTRQGWAAGDACMRAVHLVFMTKSGQPGFPTALTAKKWGFYELFWGGKEFVLPVPFKTNVMENHLTKLVTAEGHGISAVEAALQLAGQLDGRLDDIKSIHIRTQAAAMTIIDKTGPLHNAADRDHCMRYMVALTLVKKDWPEPKDYENDSEWAVNPLIEGLRGKITMAEDPQMTKDYHDVRVRNCANGLTVQSSLSRTHPPLTLFFKVTFKTGDKLAEALVEKPIGHPWRTDTREGTKTKFLRLTAGVIQDPVGVWDNFMAAELASVKVCDWVNQFALKTSS
ncbi:MmgE/PrpD family-domain-containing protein [Mycena sanguinolenta]|nr:MmgE/PrpD family-domain-containing protein [Mycena sanguinolenta]